MEDINHVHDFSKSQVMCAQLTLNFFLRLNVYGVGVNMIYCANFQMECDIYYHSMKSVILQFHDAAELWYSQPGDQSP